MSLIVQCQELKKKKKKKNSELKKVCVKIMQQNYEINWVHWFIKDHFDPSFFFIPLLLLLLIYSLD
jgi:hypothetical protein